MFDIFQHKFIVNQYVLNTCCVVKWRYEGSFVGNGRRIENNDVSVIAGT